MPTEAVTLTLDDGAVPDAEAPDVEIDPPRRHRRKYQRSTDLRTDTGGTYDTITRSWAILTANGGSITTGGLYTAPSVTSDRDITVRLTTNVTGTGTDAADGTSDSETSTITFTVSQVAVVTIATQYRYRLGDRDSPPAVPTGGQSTEDHVPADWQVAEPDPTETEAVYRVERVQTDTDGSFTSATAWGTRTRVADELLALSDAS